jgi:hypothetical protein
MYNLNCLEWHLDDEVIRKPRRVLCGLVVRQASLLDYFNRLAVALAKSQDHRASCGVFAFGDLDRQGALANSLHGLNPRNTAPTTPVGKRRTALIERLLIPLVLRWRPSQCGKRINPSSALGAFLFLIHKVWRGKARE